MASSSPRTGEGKSINTSAVVVVAVADEAVA